MRQRLLNRVWRRIRWRVKVGAGEMARRDVIVSAWLPKAIQTS